MARALRRLRSRFPSWRFWLVSASLVGTMLLAALASWVLHASIAEHERSIARSLDDYVKYAGRTFGDQMIRVAGEVRLRAMATVLGTTAPSVEEGMPLEEFAPRAAAVLEGYGMEDDPLRGYYRFDPRTGAWEARGAAARPAMARALQASIRARLRTLRREQEPALGYVWVGPDSAAVSTVWMRQMTADRRTAVILGYTSGRKRATDVLASRVLLTVPVLPPTFLSPDWRFDEDLAHSDSVVSIEMLDGMGRSVWKSPHQYESAVRGEFAFNTNPGGFVVRATLCPSVVEAITRAHSRRDRSAYVLLLPLLSALLGLSAIVHLLRERELSRAQRDFVASVSHELRTPLAQIRMFSETLALRRERSEADRIRWLGVISRESQRLGDLVENILLFSHLEGPGLRLSRQPTDLGELVEDVAATYAPMAQGKRVRIEARAPAGVVADADPRALRQVLVNLLDNALKYGPEGQTVRVGAALAPDGRALLSVSDEGPGVPPAERERLWGAFVRLTHQGGTAAGSGLGLAVVRSIVEQHGGHAWVEDAPGGGARFVVALPPAPASAAAAEGAPVMAGAAGATGSADP